MTHDAQAWWFAGPRQPVLRREEVGAPGAGEVLIEAIVSGISAGTEMLVYRGQVPASTALDLPTLQGSFGFPIKYGYASVGRVLACGEGVTVAAPGDLVFALHPHQNVYLAPQDVVIRLPPDLDPVAGVLYANLETALNIVHDTPIKLGETALVFGQGVVGLLVAMLLRRAGAARVFAVEPHAGRHALSQIAGVDAVLPGDDLLAQLCAHNEGRAADVAVEASGAPSALQSAIDAVLPEATVVVASWYGDKPVSLQLGGHFHRGRVRLRSSQVGALPPEHGPRWNRVRRSAAVCGLLPTLPLAALVTHRFPFAAAAEAYRLLDERPGETGQIVLEVS